MTDSSALQIVPLVELEASTLSTELTVPKRHGFHLGESLEKELRQIWHNGYEPVLLENKKPYMKNWQNMEYTNELIEKWCSQKPRTLGICTGVIVAVDIDVLNAEMAKEMAKLATHHLGKSDFVRVGKPPKVMLIYRCTDGVVAKSMTSFYTNEDSEDKHRVEILGDGQQAAMIGVHSSERLYQWPEKHILNYPTGELPPVSRDDLAAFLIACGKLFEDKGYTVMLNSDGTIHTGVTMHDLEFDTVVNGVKIQDYLLGDDVDFRCNASDFRPGATNESSLHVTKEGMEIIVQDYGVGITHLLSKEGFNELVTAVSGVNPLQRYIFVESENKFFVTDRYGCVCKDALNTIHRKTNPGGRGSPPLMANWLPDQEGFRTVWGLTWYPCKYRNEKKYQTIFLGPHEHANTWEGFALTPIDGDVQPWLDHLAFLFPDKEQQREVIKRLAFDIQKPWKKCNWHLVIWGVPGAGKDALITPLSMMFGNAASTVGNNDIKGDYDDGFVKKKLVTISEVRGLTGNALEELKRKAATENAALMTLNPKKDAKVTQMNLWSMVFITNHRDAMKLSPDERRFYVLNAPTAMSKEQAHDYFRWLKYEDGAAKLMQYFLDVDLSEFDKDFVPERTRQFYNMIEATDNDMETMLREWNYLKEGSFAHDVTHPKWIHSDLRRHNITATLQNIAKWLGGHGWHKPEPKIQAKVNGKNDVKSEMFRFRDDSEIASMAPVDAYHEIVRIEAFRKDSEEPFTNTPGKYS